MCVRDRGFNDAVFFTVPLGQLDAGENLRLAGVGVAIIKFGDRAFTDGLAEAAKTTRLFRDGDRQQGLSLIHI